MSDKSKFVGAEISDDQYRTLFRLGVEWGMRIHQLIPIAIKRFLSDIDVDDRVKPLDLEVFQLLQQMKRDGDIEHYLLEMAYAYQEKPTEENVDLLTQACDLTGYTMTEVLQWVEEDKLVPLSLSGTKSSKELAMAWLVRNMVKDTEYPANDIMEKAANDGFNAPVVKAAKRALGVRSERRALNWVWILRGQ